MDTDPPLNVPSGFFWTGLFPKLGVGYVAPSADHNGREVEMRRISWECLIIAV